MLSQALDAARSAGHAWLRPASAGRVNVLGGRAIAAEVAERVTASALARAERGDGRRLDELVYETLYCELGRLERADVGARAGARKRNDEDPRSAGDRAFLTCLRQELAHADELGRRELVRTVVRRYAEEIAGHFDPRVYGIATRIVPPALSALLHDKKLSDPGLFHIDERVVIEGRVQSLCALARRGTVVLAPTHVSNLDSLVLGSAIYRMGLPPFAYGAGLNLFSSTTIGFFMRNLGAYTVDRKKSDPLYRATLKEYGTLLLERGQHSLFFPGGTRSRSGTLEARLKLGLLGTTPTAFRRRLASAAPEPRLFIVPCTLTYPLVLEAASLVGDYLRAEAGSQHLDMRDEFERPRRWIDFLRGLSGLDLRIHLRIGRALDPLGNPVDDDGSSRDPHGRAIDPSRYFLADGQLAADDARDAEYTRLLAPRLLAAYRADTVVLPSSLVAYVLFQRLRRERAELGILHFLRGLSPNSSLALSQVHEDLAQALARLPELARRGALQLAPELRDARAPELVEQALRTFAMYHTTPVLERRAQRLHVGDGNLLFYYQNRLEGLMGLADGAPAEGGRP